jgi:hypothetical protein
MNVLKKIWCILCAIGQAKHAAELARSHKYEQAQALYRK